MYPLRRDTAVPMLAVGKYTANRPILRRTSEYTPVRKMKNAYVYSKPTNTGDSNRIVRVSGTQSVISPHARVFWGKVRLCELPLM